MRAPVGTAGVAADITADEGDPGQALPDEMIDHPPYRLRVRKAYDMFDRGFGQIPGLDHRNAGISKQAPRAGGMVSARHHDRLRPPPQQLFDQALFLVHVIVRGPKQDLQTTGFEPIRKRAHRIGEIGIVD